MPWIGYPETAVTQLTFTEWVFSLRARREVQIGYSVRVAGAWELFGDDKWLWFTGAVRSSRGAAQILTQWAEVEPLGPQQRVWQWVHWRNPSEVDVVVRPYVLLAPPLQYGWLRQTEPTTARKRLWTIADVVSASVTALGTAITDDPGDTGDTGGRDLVPAVRMRPLDGQRWREIEVEGDLRHVPIDELWPRIGEILKQAEAVSR
jgi:hypothetical protein